MAQEVQPLSINKYAGELEIARYMSIEEVFDGKSASIKRIAYYIVNTYRRIIH
jgi:hypothetical protein